MGFSVDRRQAITSCDLLSLQYQPTPVEGSGVGDIGNANFCGFIPIDTAPTMVKKLSSF